MRITRIHLVLAVSWPSILSVSAIGQIDSCTIRWQPIQQMSFGECFSVTPQVISSGDTLQVLWFGQARGGYCPDTSWNGIIYTHSYDGGSSFAQPKQLLDWLGAAGGPGKLAMSGSYLYLTFLHERFDTTEYYWLAFQRSTDAGMTWERRRTLCDYTPYCIAAHDSSVYIYFGHEFLDSNSVVRLRSGCLASHDYGVSFDTVAKNLPASGPDGAHGVKRLLATSRGLHFIYQRPVPFGSGGAEILYFRSTDFGHTWSPPETLSTVDSVHSQLARMDGDDGGNIYVTWMDYKYGSIDGFHGAILLRKSSDNGETWGAEQIISSVASAASPSLTVAQSRVLVTWGDNMDYYHDRPMARLSTDFGAFWCDTTGIDTVGTALDCALAGGRITTAWFRATPVGTAGNHTGEILMRRGTILTPASTGPIPTEDHLSECYPNPFNTSTTIHYELSHPSQVDLRVYDVLGRQVGTLADDQLQPAGRYEVSFDGSQLASGMYFYRLTAGEFMEVKKMMLVK